MKCPHCKTKNNFKQEGTSVYCVAKVKSGLGLCWYTLTYEERKKYFAEKRKHAERKKRSKEYWKKYYCEHRRERLHNNRKFKNGITLRQVAIIRKTSYQSVWNNLNKFDIIPGIKPVTLKFNQKVIEWVPKK